MNTRTLRPPRRLIVGAGVALGVCVGLGTIGACSPYHEQDSEQKLATATSAQLKPSTTTTTSTSGAKPTAATSTDAGDKATQGVSKSVAATSTTSSKKKRPRPTGTVIHTEPVDSAPTAKHPGVIDCISPAVIKPETLHLSCIDDSDVVTDIKWSSWDENKAEAKGQRVVNNGKPQTVTIKLSDPQQTLFGVVFETMLVDDMPVTGVSTTKTSPRA